MNYEKLLEEIRRKADLRMELLDPESLEHEECFTVNGKYTNRKINMLNQTTWTRSFFPGVLAYLYHHYKDEKYLDYLNKSLKPYQQVLDKRIEEHEMHHDAGFLYILFSGALYAVTKSREAYDMTLKVADEFAKRFRFRAGVVQGFGDATALTAMTIVDDMMNIGLLMWAYKNEGHVFYRKLFRTHIETVKKNMVREDYTVRHAFSFNPDGTPMGERNFCGYGPGSVWSRGQSWMVYGVVNAMKAIKDDTCTVEDDYVALLNGLLNMYLPKLNENGMPKWDLNCEESLPGGRIIDSSAAVILAAAIYKLDSFFDISKLQGIAKDALSYADKIFDTVVNEYRADAEAENFIEGGQVGSEEKGCVWGDYFFVELLMRKIYGKDTPDFWM
ncbi:MAG: glycoside hydrolase family 88 protein [Clostridia bacterium]|nr:glycoside hydrolase family 88 protein [Clostridia bacterium]